MSELNILLVEDNPEHQLLAKSQLIHLSGQAANVTVASTGRRFLELAQSKHFDCVVLDYTLPDFSADQLLRAASDVLNDCPAVVISCSDAQDAAIKSFRSGSLDFIPKTVAFVGGALRQRVEAAIDDARARLTRRRNADRKIAELEQIAEMDPLTGLRNRRSFERLVAETPAVDRRQATACIILDVDRFKRVNDDFGHAAGDIVLRGTADVIRQFADHGETAIRWGGEEFLLLKPSPSLGKAWVWLNQLLAALRQKEFAIPGRTLRITASAGIAWDPKLRIGNEAVERADAALYLAKNSGRDQICTWQMVFIDRLLDEWTPDLATPLEQRWEEFIKRCGSIIGPCQREHLIAHCRAVSGAAVMIANSMDLDPQTVEHVRLAGLLHDLGKILIPEDLLAKASALTPHERQVVGRHAEFGAQLARKLGAASEIVDFVAQHHDPVASSPTKGAKVLAVADAWVALTCDRSYRAAQRPDQALTIINREAGLRYDPTVVEHVSSALSRKCA